MKFQRLNDNILTKGRLRLVLKQLEDSQTGKHQVLTEKDLARLPELYASVDPEIDILALDNGDEFTSPEGSIVYGGDIKACTKMLYSYSRGAYSKIKQITQPSYSAAVPLAMLGYRNYKNIPYNTWRLSPNDWHVTIKDNDIEITPVDDDVIHKVFKLDLLLGHAFASTKLNVDGTAVNYASKYGLAHLCADIPEEYEPTRDRLLEIRDASAGNYRMSSTQTGYGVVSKLAIDSPYAHLYMKVNPLLKHMLTQRWLFYTPEKNSNMISNFKDWDTPIKSIDDILDIKVTPGNKVFNL